MNESHRSSSACGQQRSGLRTDTNPPLTSPLHTSANQESGSDKASEGWNRRVKVGGEKINQNIVSRLTVWDRMVTQQLKEKTTNKNKTQTEIPESLQARTITHCPPPPTQGRTSQRPKRVSQFRPRTTTHTPLKPSPGVHLPPCFFLLLFSSALPPLSLSVAFCPLFF